MPNPNGVEVEAIRVNGTRSADSHPLEKLGVSDVLRAAGRPLVRDQVLTREHLDFDVAYSRRHAVAAS